MHYYISLILFTISLASTLLAQENHCSCNYYHVNEETFEDKLTLIVMPDENTKIPSGEIYFGWYQGSILLNNGETLSNRVIRYDGLSDELIVNSINERVKYAVEKSTIKGFDLYLPLTSTILHFEKLNMISVFSNEYTMGYAQVLVKGKISLYASRMLEHIGTTADLEKYFTYILIRDDGKMFHFIHYSRRSLSKLFPGEKENYNLQLCKLHNKVRNEQQLIQAVGLFNILNK